MHFVPNGDTKNRELGTGEANGAHAQKSMKSWSVRTELPKDLTTLTRSGELLI